MIKELDNTHLKGYTKLIKLLWNTITDKEIAEIVLHHNMNKTKIFVYQRENEIIGFINLSIRKDYVEGSSSTGTGYIEGIYVCEPNRKNKIGYQLVNHAISFFESIGLDEIASDTEIENTLSQIFHKAIGFKEVSTIKHYIKKIGD